MEVTALHKDKSERLFTYLKELSMLRSPLIRDLQQYENILFLNDIPKNPECISPLNDNIKDSWIEIKKPIKPQFPTPPKELLDWLDPATPIDNVKSVIQLVDNIPNPDYEDGNSDDIEEEERNKYLYLMDHPDILPIFDSYIRNDWNRWKEEFIRYDKIQEIYTKLFSIYQQRKKLGEQYELVIGIGLLNWKTSDGQLAHRHVLTVSCLFQFDSSNGIIRVVPSTEDIKPEIEQDMLELDFRLDQKALTPIKEVVADLQSDLWNKSLLDSLFRSFVFSLSANGNYQADFFDNKKEASKEPTISYSPALIFRKKTEKGFQQACSTIIENLKIGEIAIPQGILRIFEELDDYNEQKSPEQNQNHWDDQDQTIFFPLDANDEQRKIITNLETRNGVLVQGPPGTGKSHTIANLTSHLLATGRRVLITSETPRALKVLKNKIPKELQALCVSLLGADSQSFKDLESVVQTISNRRDTWDKEKTEQNIKQLTNKLKLDNEKKSELRLKLRSIREKETFEHHLLNGTYKGTAQKIAMKIAAERAKYEWFTDTVEMNAAPPLSSNEASELLELLNELNDNIQEQIQLFLPSPDLLWSETDFKQKVNREQELLVAIDQYQDISEDQLEPFFLLDIEKRNDLSSLLNELSNHLLKVSAKNEPWISTALSDLLEGKFRPWEEFFNQINVYLQDIENLSSKHNLTEITGHEQVSFTQLHSDSKLLRSHFESGKGLGMPGLRPKLVKDAWYIIKEVRVDGRKCESLESVTLLEEVVHTDHTLKMIEQMITEQLKVEMTTVNSRLLRLANIKNTLEPFSLLLQSKQSLETIKQEFQNVHFISQNVLNKETITDLNSQLEYVNLKESLDALQLEWFQLIENIKKVSGSDGAHPVVEVLTNSIQSRDVENYVYARETTLKLDEFSRKSIRCEALLQKVKRLLPRLYSNLVADFDYTYWANKFSDFEKAFEWAKVTTWYTQFTSANETKLEKELDELENSIKKSISLLGAQKAWYSTLETMTEGQRQHLLAWTTSMRKVGKGTGKNAYIHLQDAQKHMAECRDAIPAWIMPLYRVFETFEVKPNLFDVVIIDEASQSGPDAVILQYIAKKLIVVGDDKQISPEYVGINREDIQYLRKQYLYDFKLADMLDIENSFFDLANVLFGGRITLREHFRCMPEIIQFSNRISYSNTPLIPLRQYPPNRLDPVKTIHVPNGYREGAGSKVFNRPEAEAIVAQIKACITDSLYNGKSMGVISLQAEGQAQLIEKLLIEEIGPEEMEKRHIICGDAYAFQGDERDIMFLSLVAAPGQTVMRALVTEKDKRRFNVAVSRAKDQLWLVHTPTINDIRNKDCLRYQLISYCENPEKEILESDRALCESEFEKAVFDQITSRGYRVIPQVEVAGYRIDLVVEGSKGKIAVECDGDQWHGPDRFDYDMNRQRILERCGWKFWRVRGSDYYYNPEKALAFLWDTLHYYGIQPVESISSRTEPFVKKTDSTSIQDNVVEKPSRKENVESKMEIETAAPPSDMFLAFHEAAAGLDETTSANINHNHREENTQTTEQLESVNTLSPVNGLEKYLIANGFEVVDKRDKGGALWLIGGEELSPIISELREYHIPFTFAYNGSKTTDKRPAWYTTYQD
ncbi:AAA domain-containing protein [Neobacillus sp. PS3-12]|uniref:AAA domain-containing protein n=1 Tax=Neobacillus sp. PS3-12 TaxID=3070677 RepID=UPI0027E07B9F|nr:AAA domain-containing protein [Neobacillus sp. PS3-12]WML53328.1 AAA domain-containing protein [Neobacillus sp. PS3-12]